MNILYVGNAQGLTNASKYYLIPQKLINGFTRLGHNVYVFNDRDHARYSNIFRSQKSGKRHMNKKLVETCIDFRPNLIVLAHCKNVDNETLHEIRSRLPKVKIIYRNVDPLNSIQNVRDINQRVGHVDALFITTAGKELKQFSNKFGGVYFMPNPVDPTIENIKAFNNKNANVDLLFLASSLRDQKDERHIVAQYILNNKEELNIHIGGAGINNNKVFGADFFDLLNQSKMGLCMNKTADYYLYASDRMSQYMGCGLLSFIPKGPCFEDVFGDDSFISFEGKEELLDKIKYFKKNEEKRIQVASAGYEKIHDYFNVEKVCNYMIEATFEKSFTQNYNWPTESH